MENKDYIKQGDCLQLMDELPERSIDMVLCDLPYGVLNRNNKDALWDIPINLESLWKQYTRVIKKNGAIILFAQGMFTAKLMQSNPKWWRYNLIWNKERISGFLNAKRQPLRCHEDIVVFCEGQPTYNPQMQNCLPHQRNHSRGKLLGTQTNRCYGKFGKAEDCISNEKYPRSIINIPHEHVSFLHPTQKPINLLGWLIKTYSNEGDIILDNCIGSGSSAIAAIRTNRHFIGYELTDKYFSIAQERIKNELLQPRLF